MNNSDIVAISSYVLKQFCFKMIIKPKELVSKLCVLITLLTTASNLNAQTITTPEVFSFKQEVFRPISYYTGQANISVPLCQIQTNEITIPISLNYIGGEGLRALNTYSNVGFGWKLSAGGVITRTKNNICDECIITNSLLNDYGTKGFFHLAQSSVTTTNDYVRNNVSSYTTGSWTTTTGFNWNYDYSPDIFSFNFLGYSGYFVMGLDKVFHIQSNDIVSAEWFNGTLGGIGNYIIYFKLTANDGTIFTFGSTEGSIEVSGGQYQDVLFQSNAWYLSEIKFTNGRVINFNYKTNYQTYLHFQTSSNQSVPNTVNPVVLDNITFNGGKVVFTSTNRTHYISNIPDQLKLIDKIELQNASNQNVSQINLTYSNYSNSRYYLLNGLNVDDKRYTFVYNSPNSLPNMTQSFGTDYWGFYNGQPETVANIVSGYRDSYLNQTLTLPAKMPSETLAQIGILTSLTYPTGEIESYEYEINKYSYAGIQTLGGYYNSFSQEYKIAGGLRIAKITLGNQVRKYKYVISFDPNNPDNPGYTVASSGILYKIPAVAFRTEPEALNFLSIEGEPHIVYSKVIEFLSDKSYTEYNMNSPLNRPDGMNNQNTNYFTADATLPNIFNYVFQSTFVGALGKNSSCALERGQVSEIKVYDSSNVLKKSTTYTYSSDPNRYNQYVASLYFAGTGVPSTSQRFFSLAFELGLQYLGNSSLAFSFRHSYCIYTFPVYLEQEVVTDYLGGNTIQNITKYRFNSQKLRSTVVTYDSRGDSIKTVYKYPDDINVGTYASMVTKKMKNFPIEQVEFKNNNVTGSTLKTYKSNGTSYVPDKVYRLVTTSTVNPFSYFNGTTKDSHYDSSPEISYDSYSSYGNVRQTTGRDGISTSYLWDATGNYVMAQVKGAAYSTISAQDSKACDYASNTLWASLNSAASTALISTYSYKPLVGMVSATNPQNITTNYTYDINNRLYLMRDDDKNIISKYRYAYKNYPDNGMGGYAALSVSITRPSTVIINTAANATASVSGGSGSFLYNWYLKNSSGTVVSSSLNSTSSSFTFTCTQTGTYNVLCEAIDNLLGISLTSYNYSVISCVSICSLTMNSGFVNVSNSILNFGSTASFNMTFYPTSTMNPNVSYLVGYIGTGCRPSGTRIININSVMGRVWEITITSSGYVYWKMTSGDAIPAYYTESTGTLTYNL
jgi:hypothetical protein